MTEQVEQQTFIKFCIKLEHSSEETIQMIQKAAAVGNCWLAASPQQCVCSCRVFWWNIKSPRWLSPHYSPDLVPWDFWLFPKLKSPLKGKRFQTISEIQENMMGQLMAIRTVWGPKVPTLKGNWGILVPCTMFLISYIFFSKCLLFIACGWIPSGQTLYNCVKDWNERLRTVRFSWECRRMPPWGSDT